MIAEEKVVYGWNVGNKGIIVGIQLPNKNYVGITIPVSKTTGSSMF
jgi:hypothetical protein